MQRSLMIFITVFIGLSMYSAVLAESTHQPAPFNSHLPIVYLYSSPTATPTITPTPQTDFINGDFEDGVTGWHHSGYEGRDPVHSWGANGSLGIRPFEGSASVRLGRDTSCLLYTSPSPRDGLLSRMPSSA